ncbi:MAG: CAP domain-containing protein [Actinobacteria bacterium]|nr:CAP domain-containing protein [Actinomycetota bacterium]
MPAPEVEQPPLHDLTSSTTISVLHANLVGSEPLSDVEEQLTEEVIDPTTTTMATTTTTTPPTTTAPPSSPRQTSPATTTTAPPPPAPSGEYRSDYEADFYGRINSLRNANGLGSLTRDGSLDSRARSWAKKMAEAGQVSHSNLSSLLPPWSAAGENVGKGGSVSSVFNALKASSGHYTVMTGDFTHVGIGVWVDGNGTLWTVHVFTR